MKRIFVAFSTYNYETNNIVCNLLKETKMSDLLKVNDCFYPSIMDSFLHVIKSDCKWFSRFSNVSSTNYAALIPIEKIQKIEVASIEKGEIPLQQLIEIRENIDTQIKKFIASIDEEQFAMQVEIPFGEKRITMELWKLLLQWFNHQTHHRGQLSLQFELIGKENDYSAIIGKIE